MIAASEHTLYQDTQAIRKVFTSGKLDSDLDKIASDIRSFAASAINEATIEARFENEIFALLKPYGYLYQPQKEQPIDTPAHITKGRTDSRVGAFVIEFKKPTALKTLAGENKAISQALTYLKSIVTEESRTAAAMITDGVKMCEIRVSKFGEESISGFSKFDCDHLRRLISLLLSLEESALTSKNLIQDFCADYNSGALFSLARCLADNIFKDATIKTEMLRSEWAQLFRLSHDDVTQQKRIEDRRRSLEAIFDYQIKDASLEYASLFSLHTAYAITIKLISYRVVSDVLFDQSLMDFKDLMQSDSSLLRQFLENLEDGEIFRQVGILNLLEGDFFSWYSASAQWNGDIAEEIRKIIRVIARYEDVRDIFHEEVAVDLFKDLYEAAVPQHVRSSFGEFYTPYWLAQHLVRSAGFPETAKTLLDPCCGSGTFLIAAIGALREYSGEKFTASDAFARIAGIDLNPLAVLTARIHYFIHVADVIELDVGEEIVIPIYLGDASNQPRYIKRGKDRFITYTFETIKGHLDFSISEDLISDFGVFIKTVSHVENHIKQHDYDEAKNVFLDFARSCTKSKTAIKEAENLLDSVIELEKSEWNGIWLRIVANFVANTQLGRFEAIVGNPPWIDWKSLPSGYREKVKALCIDKGLFSGAGRTGGISLNVCALISHVAITNWLAKGGCLAFLMPKELIYQSSYEGWRVNAGGRRVNLESVDDWSQAGHPFDPVKEDFLTFYFREGAKLRKVLPVAEYRKSERRERAKEWKDLAEADSKLERRDRVAAQIIEGLSLYTLADEYSDIEKFEIIAGTCDYVGREGIEFYPQELMLFKYIGKGPKSNTAIFENIQVTKSKYKIPKHRVVLETRYMFPLVKGPKIKTLEYDDPNLYVAFPYKSENPHSPIQKSQLRKESPFLLKFFEKFRDQLESQTDYSDSIRGDGEYYGVARTGPYSFHAHYAAFRDNTKWRATVIEPKFCPWGETKRFVFQNHAVSICERKDGAIISLDEAHYVAGILSTPIIESFMIASSDSRSFKVRPPVKIPLFKLTNPAHRKIVAKTKEAAKSHGEKKLSLLREIEKMYINILE